ncbi:ABC transporter ATP-binding protein [Acetivibrio cellulolyticus]|uniref:ABC transporter ATP-binding protein n=1 Tax=Acetivibrio cellulolyticus TaxID=35830 RepID=UPI0001E2F576|nr:ABC transporter ATP-binding protein [Acetivibrio cellulolyticus]
MPGPGGKPHNFQKPKSVGKTLKRIFGYMLEKKWMLILVAFFVIISAGAGVVGTYFLKPIINDCIIPLIGKSPQDADFGPFIQMILIICAVYLVGALSSYLYSRIMIKISHGTLNAIRKDLFESMQDLPIKYFDTHTHGELMSRYTNDVDTLREAISNGVTQLITSAITVAGTFIMMLVLSPILTLLIIVMLFVMFAIIKTIGGKSAANFKKQQKAVGEINGYIEEMIEGQKVVKVFCHEDESKIKFAQLNENMRQAATNANTYASVIMPIMGNISYFNYALTAAIGAMMVIAGRMDIGTIASFLQYTRSFSQPITQISQQFNSILAALAGAERIFEIIDEKPEQDEGYVTLVNVIKNKDGTLTETEELTGLWAWKHPHHDGSLTYTELTGDVRFEDVNFGYDEKKLVLRNVSLFAKPGQKIAFVGSTGAGKTTITNLINRFYDVPDGKIRYDGININKIKKDDLRRSLAMVLQDTHLFTGTVRENIRYGRLDATDDEVIAAANLANAHSFIRHLPQGYDTMLVSDGSNLSQGQRQLIAIARAAIANPPVLILDEATSSIDTRTEALIEKGMDELMKGRTVFVIAHRLSTVRNANAIMVLENGEVIERGNHDELIAQRGKYYQLYTGQFELS